MGLLSKLNRIVKSKYPFFRILLNRSRVSAMIIARNVFIRNFSRFITTRDRDDSIILLRYRGYEEKLQRYC